MKKYLFLTSAFLFFALISFGQSSYKERVQAYIQKYQNWAMLEQIRSGVPASITLAQGILETAAGESELSIKANNHFGIKCKSSWKGLTYTYTDDAKDECFRQYDSAYQSYVDHSDFLRTNPRYASLFLNSPLDYKSWAIGLKKAGYATNPHYATKLIQFIEEYQLAEYTVIAMNLKTPKYKYIAQKEEDNPKKQTEKIEIIDEGFEHLAYAFEDSSKLSSSAIEYYVPTTKNDLKGFYGKKGDLLLEYALKKKIRYSKLLMWNDLQDQPLGENMFIYTESKRKKGLRPTHIVQSGENLHMISQEEGIQLDQLLFLNSLQWNDQPMTGSVLNLQEPNTGKLQVETISANAKAISNTTPAPKKSEESDYILIDRGQGKMTIQIEEDEEEEANEELVKRESNPSQELISKLENNDDEKVINRETIPVSKIKVETKDASPTPENLSPLERLKAYMDNTVYHTEEEEKQANAKSVSVQSKTTLPAAQKSPQAQQQTKPVISTSDTRNPSFYIVKKGDTAFSIAKKHQITVAQLKAWNQLPASMVVAVGARLKVKP